MKMLTVLSVTLLFIGFSFQSQAQVQQKETIKETKKEVKAEKKELRTERIALRKLEGNKVSEVAKNSFNVDFGAANNAQWKRVDTYDEVAFTIDGKAVKAYYDEDGSLVGTTTSKTFAQLPAYGQKEINTKYKGYTVGPIVYYDDNENNATDMILYGLQFEHTDCYFVELSKGQDKFVVQVGPVGYIQMFKKL